MKKSSKPGKCTFLILRDTSKLSRGTPDGVRKGIESMDGKINDKEVIYMFLLESLSLRLQIV